MKFLRKRLVWILLALFLLPVLITSIWYWKQVRQQRLDHALIEAIKKNDTPSAIALLDQGADANMTDRPYAPMTLKSALTDFWNQLKGNKPPKDPQEYPSALLLIAGNFGAVDGYKLPPDNPELVKALLEHGADSNMQDEYGDTPLDHACFHQHPQTVKILLEHGDNLNRKDKDGFSPLMFAGSALEKKDDACIRLLVEHGADVNATDNRGHSALMIYIINTYFPDQIHDRVRYILQHGAKVSVTDQDSKTSLDYAEAHKLKNIIPLLEAALKKEQAEKNSSVAPYKRAKTE